MAQDRLTWGGILAASLLLNVCGLAAPRITQGVLDRVLPEQDLSLLVQLLMILLLVSTLQILLALWRRLTLVRLSLQIDRSMLGQMCSHLFSLPLSFFKGQHPGDLLGRFHDHGHFRHLFAGALTRVVIDAVMVVVYVVVMFAYSVHLSLLVLLLALCFAGFTLWLSPLLRRQHKQLMQDTAAQENHLVEALVGVDMVKAMGVEKLMQTRWKQAYQATLASNYRTQKLRQLLEAGGTVIQFLITAVLLGVGATLVIQGELTAGQLVAFSLYATQALTPLLGLITLWEEVQQARAALDRLQEVLNQEPEPQRRTAPRGSSEIVSGHVRFENVCFGYRDTGPAVLRGVSFQIAAGGCVALVGRSGSGKSTLARLLLGLYAPTTGRILVDGEDLAQWDLSAYRRNVGVVLQENLLISGTIRENIAPGDSEPDTTRLAEAACLAGADEFIRALPQGFETVVGELGLTLSGGQRQRLNLARALYRDPRILILDEPTSALDQLSQQRIEERLETMLKGRTTLLISHDPNLVRHAHRVLFLDDGNLVESASVCELLDQQAIGLSLAAAKKTA
jgi:ABC-type bacteriocin/lantibiotic exporter with double-glycine peptidase domain